VGYAKDGANNLKMNAGKDQKVVPVTVRFLSPLISAKILECVAAKLQIAKEAAAAATAASRSLPQGEFVRSGLVTPVWVGLLRRSLPGPALADTY
jgi:hypothetical protein